MKNKHVILWTIFIAIAGGIILYIAINKNQTSIDVKNIIKSVTQKTPTTNVPNITSSTPINTNVSSKTTVPSYSLSDVSKHNNQSSCWTVISGKIYDITPFISSHPAGVQKILQGCGIDATNLYGRVGAHDISKLSNSFIGNLN